ncbi:dynein regulatory complex subunit 6-like [Dreissena polymorpha]|uniref:dynein regulatory complex subunit 6-like n=1 Tax=Dreissena polymorpha TaxID=45954 RepID=UPI002263F376|nr:dynein regulatory complex subunit 6-like [Dreissena polymorpha]XP_052254664.1 dynein regulatory complex subunit 6-like [Dreissena polymorpha]
METYKTEITDLPVNILIKIFKCLSHEDLITSVRCTCKIWNQLTYERTFWKKISLSMFPDSSLTTVSFLQVLGDHADSVEVLVVNLDKLKEDIIYHEGIYCPNLVEVCLEGIYSVSISEKRYASIYDCLKKLSLKYSHLRSLNLLCSDFMTQYFNASDINSVAQPSQLYSFFENLTEVRFARGSQLVAGTWFEGCLKTFLENHRKLKTLMIKSCDIQAKTLELIFTELPNIQHLDLCNSFNVLELLELESFVDLFGQRTSLNGLKTLCLNECNLNDYILKCLVKSSRHLKELSLTGAYGITNIGLEYIAEACPELEKLYLNNNPGLHPKSNITSAGIEIIAEKCCQLTVLNLNNCTEISDVCIQAIALHCSNLQNLSVANCLSLTDSALSCVVEHCFLLQELDVSNCSQLTNKSFNRILQNCKQLRSLNAGTCHRVTMLDLCAKDVCSTDCLIGIPSLEKHSHVRQLNFSFCSAITNACMSQIGHYCRDLRTLDLQACSLVTNAGIKDIVKNCKFLKHLDISGGSVTQTSRLTDASLQDIASYGHSLETLVMVKNYNITAWGVFEVVNKCQSIHFICVDATKRSNINKDKLIALSGEVTGKTICLHFKARIEITIYQDVDLNIKLRMGRI